MDENQLNHTQDEKQKSESSKATDSTAEKKVDSDLSGSSLKEKVLNSMKFSETETFTDQHTEKNFEHSSAEEIHSAQEWLDNNPQTDQSEKNNFTIEEDLSAASPDLAEWTTKEDPEPEIEETSKRSNRKESIRKKEDTMVSRIVWIVVTALVITGLILGISFYNYWKSGLKPLDPENTELVQIEVPGGSTSKNIGNILESNKIIKSGFVFTYYVKMNNLTDFKSGYYQMAPNMTLAEICAMLKAGGTDEPVALANGKIGIPEGSSVEKVAEIVEKNTKYSKTDFVNLMKDDAFFEQMLEKYPLLLTSASEAEDVRYRLEGYLFPATYYYYKEDTLEEVAEKMVSKANDVMAQYYDVIGEKMILGRTMTVQDVLTLASLVEKEGVTTEDRRKIAQVFYNRLDADMPLQSDISVLYALNEHKVNLSTKDTEVDSPYNLYIHKGLGPGPFNNPGEDAIDAVIYPEVNDYLYFLADVSDGKVYFARTYEEHLEYKEKYIDSKNE